MEEYKEENSDIDNFSKNTLEQSHDSNLPEKPFNHKVCPIS